jgi:hypothetical protein
MIIALPKDFIQRLRATQWHYEGNAIRDRDGRCPLEFYYDVERGEVEHIDSSLTEDERGVIMRAADGGCELSSDEKLLRRRLQRALRPTRR